jgi:hypothetical protein
MNQSKTVWVLATVTFLMFIFAIGIFPLSIYLDQQIGERDFYSMFGFLAMVLLLPTSIIFCFITFRVWFSQRNKLVEHLKIL